MDPRNSSIWSYLPYSPVKVVTQIRRISPPTIKHITDHINQSINQSINHHHQGQDDRHFWGSSEVLQASRCSAHSAWGRPLERPNHGLLTPSPTIYRSQLVIHHAPCTNHNSYYLSGKLWPIFFCHRVVVFQEGNVSKSSSSTIPNPWVIVTWGKKPFPSVITHELAPNISPSTIHHPSSTIHYSLFNHHPPSITDMLFTRQGLFCAYYTRLFTIH